MKAHVHDARLLGAASMATLLTIAMLAAGPAVLAAGPATVGLGTAGSFGVLAGTTVTNTGATTINGDLGVSPGSAITGAPTVSGTIHVADAVALQAQSDLVTAYNDAAGRPVTNTYSTLGGLTLVSGVYAVSAATTNLTGTLTLDGQNDPSSVWIFKATSTFITSSSSRVALINGASPCNVFWQVSSSATLATGSTLAGTVMALTSITITSGATVNGRALARTGAVTLDNNTINGSSCSSAGCRQPVRRRSEPQPVADRERQSERQPIGKPERLPVADANPDVNPRSDRDDAGDGSAHQHRWLDSRAAERQQPRADRRAPARRRARGSRIVSSTPGTPPRRPLTPGRDGPHRACVGVGWARSASVTMDEIDGVLEANLELESQLESARKAVQEHLYSGVAVGSAAGPLSAMAAAPVDQAWFDRYDELKAAADEALTAANRAWSQWVVRTRHL